MRRHYKGFEVILRAEKSPARFRYELRHRDRVLVVSPTAYASEDEAVRAAWAFIDRVDRLVGLDPPEREG